MGGNKRIDIMLVERGLCTSRSQAQRLIMAGQVRRDGQLVHKASETADEQAIIEVIEGPKYVSRGGEKLEAGLKAFGIDPQGWVCSDVGASTGGFTDCLLQAGAASVYAIDVGKGQLHWRLRRDERVHSLERTNARYLDSLPELVDLVVIDVSFISLELILVQVSRWLKPGGLIIALIKPQFEAGKGQVGKGGVVRDPAVHRSVLDATLKQALKLGLYPAGLIQSPLKGPKGNIEFLVLLRLIPNDVPVETLIASVLPLEEASNGN